MHAFHERQLVAIAREAGNIAMQKLTPSLQSAKKADGSFVTEADIAADDYIASQIGERTLGHVSPLGTKLTYIPILSEEMKEDQQRQMMQQKAYWCVDPIDGTSLAMKYAAGDKSQNGFAVFIGLVREGVPMCGVAHFPAQGRIENGVPVGVTYYSNAAGTAAFRQEGDDAPVRLRANRVPGAPLRVAQSNHREDIEQMVGRRVVRAEGRGNRFLRVAEGAAELAYMSNNVDSPPGYWDIAAPQAILRAAGGELVTVPDDALLGDANALMQSEPVRYDGRHFARGRQGLPYLPGGMAGHTNLLRGLGAPDVGATKTR